MIKTIPSKKKTKQAKWLSEEVLQTTEKRREAKGTGEKERYTIPSSSGYVGTGGLRGATPHSRSGGEAVRRYPSTKVRSSGCALPEQP